MVCGVELEVCELFKDGEGVSRVLILCSSSTRLSRISVSVSLWGVVALDVVEDDSIDLFEVSTLLPNMLDSCFVCVCWPPMTSTWPLRAAQHCLNIFSYHTHCAFIFTVVCVIVTIISALEGVVHFATRSLGHKYRHPLSIKCFHVTPHFLCLCVYVSMVWGSATDCIAVVIMFEFWCFHSVKEGGIKVQANGW